MSFGIRYIRYFFSHSHLVPVRLFTFFIELDLSVTNSVVAFVTFMTVRFQKFLGVTDVVSLFIQT